MEVFEPEVEKLAARAPREALGFLVRVETEAVRGIEEKGGERNFLEGGPILPSGGFRPVARERLKSRLRHLCLVSVLSPRGPGEVLYKQQNSERDPGWSSGARAIQEG
jgi:hypothetical protein